MADLPRLDTPNFKTTNPYEIIEHRLEITNKSLYNLLVEARKTNQLLEALVCKEDIK